MTELEVTGEAARRVAAALANATTLRILELLSTRGLDVSTVAKKLGLTESTISIDLQELQTLGIIDVTYAKGKRGIRKICRLAKDRICIKLR